MARRDWLIKPSWLGAIGLIIAVYACVAIWHGGIITWWPRDKIDIDVLLGELAVMWVVLCSGAGILACARKRPCAPNARYWPLVIVPLIIGLWVGPRFAWSSWDFIKPTAFPFQFPLTFRLFPVGGAIFLTIGPALIMWSQAKLWLRIRLTGYCPQCMYDLTANTSGRCPECGRLVDTSPSKRFTGNTRWYPEFNLFETAAQRDEAWRSAGKSTFGTARSLFCWVPWGLVMLCFTSPVERFLGPWQWLPIGIFGGMTLAGICILHRTTRRLLRQRLIELGIPVCLRCGRDLRDGSTEPCPACRQGTSVPESPR